MSKKSSYNVWVVEDDPMFRESLEDLIHASNEFKLIHSVDSVEKAIQSFGTKETPSPKHSIFTWCQLRQECGIPQLHVKCRG